MTYDGLIAALTAYFSDTRRTRAQTREGLEALRDEINSMLESLED